MIPDHHHAHHLTEEEIATVCVYCRRVRADGETWLSRESCPLDLMTKHLSHGACPSCFDKALAGLEEEIRAEHRAERKPQTLAS